VNSCFFQSITGVFGGRSRDRGSSGDWAVQDIGSAVGSEDRGWCFLGLNRRLVLPQLRASIPRCCAIMSPCRCGLPRARWRNFMQLWRTLLLAVPNARGPVWIGWTGRPVHAASADCRDAILYRD